MNMTAIALFTYKFLSEMSFHETLHIPLKSWKSKLENAVLCQPKYVLEVDRLHIFKITKPKYSEIKSYSYNSFKSDINLKLAKKNNQSFIDFLRLRNFI